MTMPTPGSGRVPILECVREGFMFLVRDWRGILGIAAIAALALTPLDVWSQMAAQRSDIVSALAASVLGLLVQAWVLGAFYRRTLSRGVEPLALRFGADERNLAGVALAISFFMMIALFVCLFVIILALAALLAGGDFDAGALQSLPAEEAARRFAAALGTEGQAILFVLFAAMAAGFLWISARLSLAGPATVDTQRMQAFSTWSWTKGNSGPIALCLVILGLGGLAAMTFIGALPMLAVQTAFGGEAAVRTPGSPGHLIASYLGGLLGLTLFLAPYAGMSAYLYRGLRPQ